MWRLIDCWWREHIRRYYSNNNTLIIVCFVLLHYHYYYDKITILTMPDHSDREAWDGGHSAHGNARENWNVSGLWDNSTTIHHNDNITDDSQLHSCRNHPYHRAIYVVIHQQPAQHQTFFSPNCAQEVTSSWLPAQLLLWRPSQQMRTLRLSRVLIGWPRDFLRAKFEK